MPYITPFEILKELPLKAMVEVSCETCKTIFKKTKQNSKLNWGYENRRFFCSNKCRFKAQETVRENIKCVTCNKQFVDILIRKRKFCSKSCATLYNNTHKKHGSRRSKLEIWIEKSLTSMYPNLEIHFNRKDAINSELDIYIPSLKLAFELNGIYHYEPIHGDKLLDKIKNNDNRKFQACLEHNIELCIIDTSNQVYFKEQSSNKYLNIIKGIVDNKLN